MNSAITRELTPTARAGLPAELEYILSPEDYRAAWRYLARCAAEKLPQPVRDRLHGVTIGMILGIPLLMVMAAILLCSLLVSGKAGEVCISVGLPVAFFLPCPFLAALGKSPWLVGKFSLAWPFRRPCFWGLGFLARRQARQGLLDTASAFSFTMTAEGFTCIARREHSSSVLDIATTRQDRGPWAALVLVGATAEHLFLVAASGQTVILPARAFPDGHTFTAFTEVLQRYHGGAGVHPSPTGITVRTESIRDLPSPCLSEDVTR
jgi:hypothetical protein